MLMYHPINAAGDTRTPTIIKFFGFWLLQIPLAYFLSIGLDLKSYGALIAVPVAETVIAIVAWYYFRKGKWKEVKV